MLITFLLHISPEMNSDSGVVLSSLAGDMPIIVHFIGWHGSTRPGE